MAMTTSKDPFLVRRHVSKKSESIGNWDLGRPTRICGLVIIQLAGTSGAHARFGWQDFNDNQSMSLAIKNMTHLCK